MGTAKEVSYVDPNNKKQTGYIIDGKTYTDMEGKNRIATGSVVTAADGQKYKLTDQGGVKFSGATTTGYIDPSGKAQVGYIVDGKTYTDPNGNNRVAVGSVVTTSNGTQYQLTDQGGVLYTGGNTGRSTATTGGYSASPPSSSYVGTLSGVPTLSAPTPVQTTGPAPTDNSSKIEEYYKLLEEGNQREIEKAISEGKFNLNTSLQAALPGFQTSRQQADFQTEQTAGALKEQMALMGDRGGMSRQDILQNQTAGSNMLNTINMQEQKLRTDTQSQIDHLVSQGNLQGAILAAQTGAERIGALVSESTRMQDAQYKQWQDSFNNSLSAASLTGYYNGAPTLAGQGQMYNQNLAWQQFLAQQQQNQIQNQQNYDMYMLQARQNM